MKMYLRYIALLIGLSILSVKPGSAQGYSASPSDSIVVTPRDAAIESLLSIMATAEDIMDFALIKDWSRIQSDVATLEKAWAKYDSGAVKDATTGVLRLTLGNSLTQLRSAAKDKNSTSASQAANNLSSHLGNLLEGLNPPFPSDIYLLEILERQLNADGSAGNFEGADRCLDKLKMVWNRTKGKVQDRRGYELAGRYTASLRAQEIAAGVEDGPALSSEASKGMQILLSIKELYK